MKGEGGRSWSSSMSSLFSWETQQEFPAAHIPDESSKGSTTSEDDSESDGKGEACLDDRDSDSSSSSDDESSSSSESDSGEASDDEGTQQGGSDNEGEGLDSEAEGSDAGGGSCPSESDHKESSPKASSPAKKAWEVNLNASQMLSLLDLVSKDYEEEWKAKQCWVVCLLDTNFSKWQNQKISEGHLQWDECDKKTYDHADPCKEAKCSHLLGLPLDYMTSHSVFKPKKTSEYDLCCFYQVGLSGDLPQFPLSHLPATCKQVSSFLLKARALGQPNLIIAHSQDMATTVCLLQELHIRNSLHHLPMETKAGAGSKSTRKLSFCPFCQYSGSNDQSYMNHIICGHYNANYGCSKCLNKVFMTGQPLPKHMKTCNGLPKKAMDKATAEDISGKKKSKSKDLPADLQPPSQSSQGGSQVNLHCSQCTKEKATATLQESDSHKKKKCSFSHKHCSKSSKDKDKPSECCTTKSSGTSKDKCDETSKEKSSDCHEVKSGRTSKDKPTKKSKDKSGECCRKGKPGNKM